MRLTALAIVAACSVGSARAEGGALLFGTVTVSAGVACLNVAPRPSAGTRVLLVDAEEPQKTFPAAVAAGSRCRAPAGQGGPAPAGAQLTWSPRGRVSPLIGIVGGIEGVATRDGAAVVRAAGFPQGLRFRSCASSDGLHLTVWNGAPLRSPRVWEGYVYLNQDLDADCTASETR